MARVEIDEADLAAYKGMHNVLQGMMQNPEARNLVLKARKVVDPKVAIPEIDAAAPVQAVIGELRSEMQKMREEQAEERRLAKEAETIKKFEDKWEGQARQLRGAGWREAGIEQVKKFAEENAIADLSIAADAWEKRNPAPAPSTNSGGLFGMFGGQSDEKDTYIEDMMKTGGQDESLLDREIARTLADVRSNR